MNLDINTIIIVGVILVVGVFIGYALGNSSRPQPNRLNEEETWLLSQYNMLDANQKQNLQTIIHAHCRSLSTSNDTQLLESRPPGVNPHLRRNRDN